MEEVFGPVTSFTVMLVITLLTQWVKVTFTLTDRQVQFVALGFSIVLITAYQLLSTHNFDPLAIFSAFIFSLLGWFSAIGMYEVASKQLAKPK